jgi:hypothetical protein
MASVRASAAWSTASAVRRLVFYAPLHAGCSIVPNRLQQQVMQGPDCSVVLVVCVAAGSAFECAVCATCLLSTKVPTCAYIRLNACQDPQCDWCADGSQVSGV